MRSAIILGFIGTAISCLLIVLPVGELLAVEPIVIKNANSISFDLAGDLVAAGEVVISWKDYQLTAPLIIYWQEGDLIYAQRGAVLTRGEEKISSQEIGIYQQTGEIFASDISGALEPWETTARRIEGDLDGRLTMHRARLTTCDSENPHYYFTGSRFYYYPGDRLTGYNVTMWVGAVPVFYLPWIGVDLGDRLRRWQLRPGYSSRDGLKLEANYRYLLPLDGKPFASTIYSEWSEYVRPGFGLDFDLMDDQQQAYLSYFQSSRRPLVEDAEGKIVRADQREDVWKLGAEIKYHFLDERWRFKTAANWTNYQRFNRDFSRQLAPRAESDRWVKGGLFYRGERSLLRLEAREDERVVPGGGFADFERYNAVMPGLSYQIFPVLTEFYGWFFYSDLTFELDRTYTEETERYLWSGRTEATVSKNIIQNRFFSQSLRLAYGFNYNEVPGPDGFEMRDHGDVGFELTNRVRLPLRSTVELDYSLQRRTSRKSEAVVGEVLGVAQQSEENALDRHRLDAALTLRRNSSYFELSGGYDLRNPVDQQLDSDSRLLPVIVHANLRPGENWDWHQYLRYDPRDGDIWQANTKWRFDHGDRLELSLGWNYNRDQAGEHRSFLEHGFDWTIVPKNLRLRGQVSYDLEESDFDEMRFLLDRNLHCWDMQLMYRELSDADRQIWMMLTLSDYPDRGLGMERDIETDEVDLTGSIPRE